MRFKATIWGKSSANHHCSCTTERRLSLVSHCRSLSPRTTETGSNRKPEGGWGSWCVGLYACKSENRSNQVSGFIIRRHSQFQVLSACFSAGGSFIASNFHRKKKKMQALSRIWGMLNVASTKDSQSSFPQFWYQLFQNFRCVLVDFDQVFLNNEPLFVHLLRIWPQL